MTLSELMPTFRGVLSARLEAKVWPTRTRSTTTGDLELGGMPATELAALFGTPCTVLDEAEIRDRCRSYRAALPEAEIAYAGKSLTTRAVLRIMAEEGLSLDTCSAGEVAVARAANFPAERILLHGNVKTPEELKAALEYGVGRIVLDSLDEITQLGALVQHPQRVLIRVTPGVDAHTHRAITTGTEDQKFGFSLATGAALDAVRAVLRQPGLILTGLHCHIGSQVTSVPAYEQAARIMIQLLARIRTELGLTLTELDLGGGHAVPYREQDPDFDLTGYAHRIRCALAHECGWHRFPVPRLIIEPGRAIVGPAGVTLYRVITVKRGTRTFVAVDGGMSDNPRPALYGARYTMHLVGRCSTAPRRPVTVVGRHCEAGDVLAEEVPLPDDIHAGDLIAVPCTGAYHHSLASNYNMVGRPPLIAVREGSARLIVRRETEEDLLARDLG